MKKIDPKKIIILGVIAIIVLVVTILLLNPLSDKSKNKKDEGIQTQQAVVENYYIYLTEGQNTPYSGAEILYIQDETKLENISQRHIISTIIKYLEAKKITSEIKLQDLINSYSETIPKIEYAKVYDGKAMRNAAKVLFGIEDFPNLSIEGDFTYLTSYYYLNQEDAYVVIPGNQEDSLNPDKQRFVDHSIISTEEKDNKVTITVAIAYCSKNEETTQYASDRNGSNIVEKRATEFPKDKIDKFDKYTFTLVKSKDGKNYIFESVKKVK